MTRPSPERLALARALLASKNLAPCARPIPARPDAREAPLSFAQERLFFLELYEPGTPLYNDSLAVHVSGPIEPELLRRALTEVARRHAPLRTAFELGPRGPRQRVHETAELPWRCCDVSGVPGARSRALELAREDARAPFDLERGPPWRATLVRVADGRWLLAITMHHIVSDGASYGILLRELSESYAALAEGRPAALPELSVQFGDYSAWERASHDEQRIAALLASCREFLGGEVAALDWRTGTRRSGSGAQEPVRVPEETRRGLERFARRERVTSNHVLLAAFAALLAGRSGERDLRLAVASSLRKRPELELLIGFFVQTSLLRVRLAPDASARALVHAVREASLTAARHDDVPYDRLVRGLGGDWPPIQACFSHMRDAIQAPRLGAAPGTFEFVDPGAARFELSLVLHEAPDGISGFLEHDLGLFPAPEAARLVQEYLGLLRRLLECPEAPLALPVRPEHAGDVARRRRRPPIPFPGRMRRASGE